MSSQQQPKELTRWQILQSVTVILMFFILLLRLAGYMESKTNIPVGGDAKPHNNIYPVLQ
jgi:hypothetical protein